MSTQRFQHRWLSIETWWQTGAAGHPVEYADQRIEEHYADARRRWQQLVDNYSNAIPVGVTRITVHALRHQLRAVDAHDTPLGPWRDDVKTPDDPNCPVRLFGWPGDDEPVDRDQLRRALGLPDLTSRVAS